MAYEDYEAEGPLYGPLELGVTSLVYALNAAGCVSASSCRGHPGLRSGCPWALFAGSRDRVAKIAKLAAQTGAGIENMDGGGVALFGHSIVEMVEVAEAIFREAPTFDGMASSF